MVDMKRVLYANSVFEQPWWLDTVACGKWGEATVVDGDQIIARLPYVLEHGSIKNPPYTQTLGIWMADELKGFVRGNSQLHRQKDIIFELVNQLPKVSNIDLILDHAINYILPFRWKGFFIEPTFSYRICDLATIDEVKSKMGKTVIKNIKAAQRNLIIEDSSYDYQTFIELQNSTFQRQNRKPPFSNEFTLRVMKTAVDENAGRLMVARDKDGVAHGAVFFLFDEKTCYYLLSGQNPKFKSDGSQNLLLLKGIEFASTVSNEFDFEGSMVEGIENFFRQFGGEQVINYRVSKKSVIGDVMDIFKPRIKRLIGYKI